MMDAAAAAAMSDPDRNPHFRRLWDEAEVAPCSASLLSAPTIGTLGMALREALDRRRRAEQALAVATSNGDPPR